MYPTMEYRIKEIKCGKCSCKVAANQETVDLAINTCSFRKESNCGLEQQVHFAKRMEAKQRGEAKAPPVLPSQPKQLPALLQKKWPYPVKSGQIEVVPEGDWLANPMQCRYCAHDEVSFIAQNGCPCHIYECPLDADLTAAGRNPCPHEEKKTAELKDMRPANDPNTVVRRHQIMKDEKCDMCGYHVRPGDMPCDINCHYMSSEEVRAEAAQKKVVGNSNGTFDFEVPDVLVITITKKRRLTEEWRSE